MVVRQPSKLVTWVRFPSPAPTQLYDRNPRFAGVVVVSCAHHDPTWRQRFGACSSVSRGLYASTSGARVQQGKVPLSSRSTSDTPCPKRPEKERGRRFKRRPRARVFRLAGHVLDLSVQPVRLIVDARREVEGIGRAAITAVADPKTP